MIRPVKKPAKRKRAERAFNSTLPRPQKPLPRSRMKRRAKSAATYAQQYLSAEFVEFVQARPCAICGVRGYSVAAHTKGIEKKGTGQKTSWRTLAPLCEARPFALAAACLYRGCHYRHDNEAGFRSMHGPKIRRAIAALHADWRQLRGGNKSGVLPAASPKLKNANDLGAA